MKTQMDIGRQTETENVDKKRERKTADRPTGVDRGHHWEREKYRQRIRKTQRNIEKNL